MNHSELSHMAGAVYDSTINIVLGILYYLCVQCTTQFKHVSASYAARENMLAPVCGKSVACSVVQVL